MEIKKMLTKKNIGNGLFIAFILLVLFVPSAKALLMQGLMQLGLFRPTIETEKQVLSADLSAIKFKDAKGNVVSLADLKGKVVFINFWATWCPPCLAEMPSVNKLHQQFGNDKEVVFLMVDADSNFEKAQAYMDRKKYKMPVYIAASTIPDVLFKGSLPTTVVLDKEGRLSYNEAGAANYSSPKFIDFIQQLKALKY
jgi:thiol-disulfide isomerase/thioredoxin